MEILLPRIKYIRGIVGTHGGALLAERAPGACSGSKIPRVYRPLKVPRRNCQTVVNMQNLGGVNKVHCGLCESSEL